MNWKKIFFWFKKTQPINLDQKLIKKIQSNFLPNPAQLKYIRRFLNKTEKRIINLMLLMIAIAVAGWGLMVAIRNSATIPASGGDYSEALIGQPKFINPIFSSTNDVDADLASLIYSGLFRYDQNKKLIPDLAQNYSISTNTKVYNIALRQDVKWSDGEPFTADDVIFTFETIQNPETNSQLLPAFQGVRAEKKDDYSVRFILEEPFAPFLDTLTVGILPQHIWSDVAPAEFKLAKTNLQPMGTGPWQFDKLTKDSTGNIQSYILTRNKKYFKKTPYLQTLTFKFYVDYTQAASAVKSQDVMALSFVPDNLAGKIAGKNFALYKFKLPQYTALFFNQNQNNALKDYDLRLALTIGLNKEKLLSEALNGQGEIINYPLLKGMLGYNSKLEHPSFDANKANELLNKKWKKIQPEEYYKTQYNTLLKTREAEIDSLRKTTSTAPSASTSIEKIEKEISDAVRQDMQQDQIFYRQDKNGNPLQLAITIADTPEYQQVAKSIAKMWRSLGIQTKTQFVDSRQIAKDVLKTRDYQILLYGEIVGADPDPYPFWHSSQIDYPGSNLSLFVDRNADKILEDAHTTTDARKRADLYEKFQKILAKEIPAIFLYAPVYNFAVNKNIKGIYLDQINSPADRYNALSDWYIKTKRQWKFKKH